MEDRIYQSFLKKVNEIRTRSQKYDIFYTKVKGLAYISVTNNRLRERQIRNLQNEINEKDALIQKLKGQAEDQAKVQYSQNRIIEYLEKKISKCKEREDEINRINSIESPKEKVQAIVQRSEQIYEKFQKRVSIFNQPKIRQKIELADGQTVVLNKNGTYYFEPDESFFQNVQYLFLSIANEPNKNIEQKVHEILYNFEFSQDDIEFMTKKFLRSGR